MQAPSLPLRSRAALRTLPLLAGGALLAVLATACSDDDTSAPHDDASAAAADTAAVTGNGVECGSSVSCSGSTPYCVQCLGDDPKPRCGDANAVNTTRTECTSARGSITATCDGPEDCGGATPRCMRSGSTRTVDLRCAKLAACMSACSCGGGPSSGIVCRTLADCPKCASSCTAISSESPFKVCRWLAN